MVEAFQALIVHLPIDRLSGESFEQVLEESLISGSLEQLTLNAHIVVTFQISSFDVEKIAVLRILAEALFAVAILDYAVFAYFDFGLQ